MHVILSYLILWTQTQHRPIYAYLIHDSSNNFQYFWHDDRHFTFCLRWYMTNPAKLFIHRLQHLCYSPSNIALIINKIKADLFDLQ